MHTKEIFEYENHSSYLFIQLPHLGCALSLAEANYFILGAHFVPLNEDFQNLYFQVSCFSHRVMCKYYVN